jgi:hypothetical protein
VRGHLDLSSCSPSIISAEALAVKNPKELEAINQKLEQQISDRQQIEEALLRIGNALSLSDRSHQPNRLEY